MKPQLPNMLRQIAIAESKSPNRKINASSLLQAYKTYTGKKITPKMVEDDYKISAYKSTKAVKPIPTKRMTNSQMQTDDKINIEYHNFNYILAGGAIAKVLDQEFIDVEQGSPTILERMIEIRNKNKSRNSNMHQTSQSCQNVQYTPLQNQLYTTPTIQTKPNVKTILQEKQKTEQDSVMEKQQQKSQYEQLLDNYDQQLQKEPLVNLDQDYQQVEVVKAEDSSIKIETTQQNEVFFDQEDETDSPEQKKYKQSQGNGTRKKHKVHHHHDTEDEQKQEEEVIEQPPQQEVFIADADENKTEMQEPEQEDIQTQPQQEEEPKQQDNNDDEGFDEDQAPEIELDAPIITQTEVKVTESVVLQETEHIKQIEIQQSDNEPQEGFDDEFDESEKKDDKPVNEEEEVRQTVVNLQQAEHQDKKEDEHGFDDAFDENVELQQNEAQQNNDKEPEKQEIDFAVDFEFKVEKEKDINVEDANHKTEEETKQQEIKQHIKEKQEANQLEFDNQQQVPNLVAQKQSFQGSDIMNLELKDESKYDADDENEHVARLLLIAQEHKDKMAEQEKLNQKPEPQQQQQNDVGEECEEQYEDEYEDEDEYEEELDVGETKREEEHVENEEVDTQQPLKPEDYMQNLQFVAKVGDLLQQYKARQLNKKQVAEKPNPEEFSFNIKVNQLIEQSKQRKEARIHAETPNKQDGEEIIQQSIVEVQAPTEQQYQDINEKAEVNYDFSFNKKVQELISQSQERSEKKAASKQKTNNPLSADEIKDLSFNQKVNSLIQRSTERQNAKAQKGGEKQPELLQELPAVEQPEEETNEKEQTKNKSNDHFDFEIIEKENNQQVDFEW